MKILIDTNILIDYIVEREPYSENAEKILKYCMERKIDGCIAAHTVMNTFYILRKIFTLKELKEIFTEISNFLTISSIDKEKIFNAFKNDKFDDFEDCLQAECAKEFNADYIITRNIKDFENSEISAILPDEFLKKL